MLRFELRARVYIGGGGDWCTWDAAIGRVCGGDGFSLLYADIPRDGLGTGGDGSGSLNLSTTAALMRFWSPPSLDSTTGV